jgi:hypothetical protein
LPSIKPGIYRLTTDHPALTPDARVKYDWRNMPVREGTLFVVRVETSPLSDKPACVLARLHGYAHQRVWLDEERVQPLLRALVPVENPTAMQHLALLDRAGSAEGLLDYIVASGRLSLADLEKLLEAYDAANRPRA